MSITSCPPHHWKLNRPADSISTGTCKHCGSVRTFDPQRDQPTRLGLRRKSVAQTPAKPTELQGFVAALDRRLGEVVITRPVPPAAEAPPLA